MSAPHNLQPRILERDLSDPALFAREDDHLGWWAHLEFKALTFLLVEALTVEAASDDLGLDKLFVEQVSGGSKV
jgi:hypothetical protein